MTTTKKLTRNHKLIITSGYLLAIIVSIGFMKLAEIGPVILVISNDLGIGVHSGDLLVLIPLTLAFIVNISIIMHHSRR